MTNCCKCGSEITFIEKFSGLPCNQYCCICCTWGKISPCPREKSTYDAYMVLR